MRETLETVTASLMQNMVQIRKEKNLFRDKIDFLMEKVLLGPSALRAPTVGPLIATRVFKGGGVLTPGGFGKGHENKLKTLTKVNVLIF